MGDRTDMNLAPLSILAFTAAMKTRKSKIIAVLRSDSSTTCRAFVMLLALEPTKNRKTQSKATRFVVMM